MENTRFHDQIVSKTIGEIRTFLDEVANGTSNYRSLHNLTEQVEHQYHGRFLIELIQNAYDALFEKAVAGDQGRIEVVIANDEKPFGALYIANDGNPFTDSNFQTLSKFGQSDKDPEKHVGNKGIGFRSVLEITKTPEIYSRESAESESFNGYCFCFNHDVTKQFEEPILELVHGVNRPESPIDPKTPLVEWGDEKLKAFRARCSSLGENWLIRELNFLSPYLLPIPIQNDKKTQKILDFEVKGFATVIRLLFMSEKAKELTLSELEALDENTVLFLNRVKTLWIDSENKQRLVTRKGKPLNDRHNGFELEIDVTETEHESVEIKRYWLWEQILGGNEKPEEAQEIQEAVADLPGKWPELKRVAIALAVRLGDVPEEGRINIFLPTELPTGCAAHFSSPFYGDISRKYIDFDQPFNRLLLERIAEKAFEIIQQRLAGKAVDHARAIIDILAPFPSVGEAGKRWWSQIESLYAKSEIKLEEEPIALTENGWNCLANTSLLPDREAPEVITDEELRLKSTFPVFNQKTLSRKDQIRELYSTIDISVLPSDQELAGTIERIAKKFHSNKSKIDWNGFWNDVMSLFPNSTEYLKDKEVLLGTDDELHASSKGCSVFFRPRAGGTDDEVLSEKEIGDLPKNLRPFIAFLNESIRVHVPRPEGGIQVTPIHRYLSSGLVQPFGVENILRNVLIPATPNLPIALGSRKARLCRDIFQWGLRLVASLIAKDKGEKTLSYLGRLPVPCQGGWYPLNEASFGPGWHGTVGEQVHTYLESASTKEGKEAMARLMLSPGDKLWGKLAQSNQELLAKAGAFDGLRLIEVTAEDWYAKLYVSGGEKIELPEKSPPNFDENSWKMFADQVAQGLHPYYNGVFPYEVQKIYILPGLSSFKDHDLDTKLALMKVLLKCLPEWNQGWDTLYIRKIGGEGHRLVHESPLHFWLRQIPWLVIPNDNGFDYSRPQERWYIPSLVMAGRSYQFSHLNPLPGEIAANLDSNPELIKVLQKLDMPKYDPENSSSNIRLLEDLARALSDPEIEITNMDVFLGHVRTAWSLFEPDLDGTFPKHLVVHNGVRDLRSIIPSENSPVYLPDATSAFHEGLELHSEPIVAIEGKDAKRLAKGFRSAYGGSILLASELTMQPLVGGKSWKGDSGGPLSASELKWLMPIVLSVFAFSGPQARGTQTKTFSKGVDNLREAKICWVDSLEAGLWQGNEIIANTPVPALWLPKTKTLLSLKENQKMLNQLSESFGAILDRSDLDIPLKLVLVRLQEHYEPAKEDIIASLKQLRISESHLAEIEQLWLGDLAWKIRLLKPFLLMLNPKIDFGPISEINSDEELKHYLEEQDLGPLKIDELLSITKHCEGFHILGRRLFEIIGVQFQLDRWNEILSKLDESPVENEDASEQFKEHIETAHVPLRSILRRILRDNTEMGLFTDFADQLDAISCPEEYTGKYWIVDFASAMQTVKPLFVAWKASPKELEAIEMAKSNDDLIAYLENLRLEPILDPIEIYAHNRDRCRSLLQKVQQAAILWCLKNEIQMLSWEKETDELLEHINNELNIEGYIDQWSDAKFFAILGHLSREESHRVFWEKYDKSMNFHDFLAALSISANDLKKADEKLKLHKEKLREKKRMVRVCGKEFDRAEHNLNGLWNHIHNEINERDMPTINLDELAELKEVTSHKAKRRNGNGKQRLTKPRDRMSQDMKNLIGLAGEIHAYRVILKTYGPSVVNPSCWISENSLRKFPQNKVDDDFGCDFLIHCMGKKYYIEVKATEVDEESFELGLSQIRRAVELANKRSVKFLVLHVTKALSREPEFQFLPNPYDRRFQRSYDIQNAGLRIRYKKSS